MQRSHVEMIDVRTFFAIDLDADEMLVEKRAVDVVLETLVLHHVAPVTGRVADAQKDRPIELLGQRDGFIAQANQLTGLLACWRR